MNTAGSYGQWVVQKTRPDILRKFQEVVEQHKTSDDNNNLMAQYIHQCNAQNPTWVSTNKIISFLSISLKWQLFVSECEFVIWKCSIFRGESAFHAMMSGFGWAKNPMLNRIHELRDDKPITLLYGSRSWIDKSSWDLVKEARKSSFVNTQVHFTI